MRVHALGQGHVQRHEQRWPDHRVEPRDLLRHDVHGRGPVLLELARRAAHRGVALAGRAFAVRLGQTERCDVVEQRVNPHVNHVLLVPRHAHAPGEVGAADGHVVQAALQALHHLVPPRRGGEEIRVLLVQLLQLLLKRAQLEVVVLLGRPHHVLPGDGRLVVQLLRLRLGVVLLLALVVPPLELPEVHRVLFLQQLHEFLHLVHVRGVRGADEPVERDVHPLHDVAEVRRVLIRQRLRLDALLLRALLHLQPVLVRAGQEEHVLAA